MIKGLIFDFDGVLVPIDVTLKQKLREKIIIEYCTKTSVTKEQALAHFNQAISKSTYDDAYYKIQDAALQLNSFQKNEFNNLFDQLSQKRVIKLDNTIVDMLRCFKEYGLIIGIVTLSSKERIDNILLNTNVRKYFDFISSIPKKFLESPRSEWKKDAYQSFLTKYKLKASEVMCLGDTQSIDIQPSNYLGIHSVLVIHDDNRELTQKGIADHVLDRDTLHETLPLLILDINN